MLNDIITLLRQRFEAIRDERRTSANTATRIGDAFLSLLSFLENAVGSFLRKDQDDETNFFVTFLRGVFFGHYTPGALGTGGAVTVDENGNSSAEFDFLTIRKAAAFRSITILELKHIGGELGITAGAMKVSRVEEMDDAYRCYFDTTDGKRQVYQEFVVGDQARCQAFRLSQAGDGMLTTKYYWRLVVGVGDDYVDLSKSVADTGSGIPEEGDEVIQLGYRGDDHPERQSAIILSAVASDAPSQKFYQGIDSFNLTDRFVKDEGFDPPDESPGTEESAVIRDEHARLRHFVNAYSCTFAECLSGGLKCHGHIGAGVSIGYGKNIQRIDLFLLLDDVICTGY